MFFSARTCHLLSVLVFMTIINTVIMLNGIKDCLIEGPSIVCDHSLPKILPDNVTRVIIKDFLKTNISNDTFTHITWRSVRNLDITVNINVKLEFEEQNFQQLEKLEVLGIHSPLSTFGNENSFLRGLKMLHTLDLSACNELELSDISVVLESQHSLDTLVLDQVGTFSSRFLVLDNSFFEIVSKLNLRKLSLSGCNLLFEVPFFLSNLSYNLIYLNVSNITMVNNFDNLDTEMLLKTVLQNITSLDISLIRSRFLSLNYEFLSENIIVSNCKFESDDIKILLLTIEHLKFNGVLSRNINATGSIINFSNCKVNLKTVHLRKNHLIFLNITILLPYDIQVYELDLSSNDMEYLSPFTFGSITSLEIFHLAHNKLYLMAPFSEFMDIFSTHIRLRYLDLSNNKLHWLPYSIFSKNSNLTDLDLSYNHLTTISFEIRHLSKMEVLKLDYNWIHYIDGTELNKIVSFLQNMPNPAEISFAHNPLICNCDAVPFISWIYTKLEESKTYMCSLKGDELVVNNYAIDEARFLCVRSKLIISTVSVSSALLVAISLNLMGFVYRKRKRKQKQQRADFLEMFKQGRLEQKFLCFLSYSSVEDENQMSKIHECLTESLKELTGVEQELVCEGNKQFNLGFPIIDEILRCISESCVGVYVVSNNFCESHWCQSELREAYELKKPIILIFKDNIDPQLMSPLMLKIFRQYTRAKLVTNENGEIEIIPDFEQVSKSILKLAAVRYEENNEIV